MGFEHAACWLSIDAWIVKQMWASDLEILSGLVPDCNAGVSFVRLTRLIQNINNQGTDDRRPAGSDRDKVELYLWRRRSDWWRGVILTEPWKYSRLESVCFISPTHGSHAAICLAFQKFLFLFSRLLLSYRKENQRWSRCNISDVSARQQWAKGELAELRQF